MLLGRQLSLLRREALRPRMQRGQMPIHPRHRDLKPLLFMHCSALQLMKRQNAVRLKLNVPTLWSIFSGSIIFLLYPLLQTSSRRKAPTPLRSWVAPKRSGNEPNEKRFQSSRISLVCSRRRYTSIARLQCGLSVL